MSEWISVKDRLPEIYHQKSPYSWSISVLCCTKNREVHLMCFTDRGFWQNFQGKYIVPNHEIIFWMPLPDPPETSKKKNRRKNSTINF